MTIAPFLGDIGRMRDVVKHGIDIDIIIAATVHLGEWYLAHLVR